MDKNKLIQQINNFLDESPFDNEEMSYWKQKMQKMSEIELSELLDLLKEKLDIITQSNDVFIEIAEDIAAEQDKSLSAIPNRISIIDMPINNVAFLFKTKLLPLLKDEKFDIFYELDQYFSNSGLAGENVTEGFDILSKSLLLNNEILTRKFQDLKSLTIADWLKFYNAFIDKPDRTSMDRINFVNHHEIAKKLDQKRKDLLLKLIKVYDFFINPLNIENESLNQEDTSEIYHDISQDNIKNNTTNGEFKQPKVNSLESKAVQEEKERENRIDELAAMAGRFPVGSLERKAVEEELRKYK